VNILFVLYGDLTSNSANPLALYSREFARGGIVVRYLIPSNVESIDAHSDAAFHTVLYGDALCEQGAGLTRETRISRTCSKQWRREMVTLPTCSRRWPRAKSATRLRARKLMPFDNLPAGNSHFLCVGWVSGFK
jgi:hypothetical protein